MLFLVRCVSQALSRAWQTAGVRCMSLNDYGVKDKGIISVAPTDVPNLGHIGQS